MKMTFSRVDVEIHNIFNLVLLIQDINNLFHKKNEMCMYAGMTDASRMTWIRA